MITLRFDTLALDLHGRLNDAAFAARTFTGVSIDSRTITPGRLFVAIRGEVNDGHAYAVSALERGAAGILGERDHPALKSPLPPTPVVTVENPHAALIELATQYRRQLHCKRVAITGSNGKTTTKELTYRLLQAVEPSVYRTPGNLNNLYGLPLTILGMSLDTRVGVFELGISVPGEMSRLAPILEPDLVAITNVGPSHLEFLGTIEHVAEEKISLVSASSPTAPLIVNADNDILMRVAQRTGRRLVTFGRSSHADYRTDDIIGRDDGVTAVTIEGHEFHLRLFGDYQIQNLLASYAIVRELGYSFDTIDTTTIELSTAPMRGERLSLHGVTFIADCYNANPDSMAGGLRTLAAQPRSGRLLVVLGDMLELGEHSRDYHRQIGSLLARLDFNRAYFVGPLSKSMMDGALEGGADESRLAHFENATLCADRVRHDARPGDLVYVKGSRGIGLETVLERWRSEGGSH